MRQNPRRQQKNAGAGQAFTPATQHDKEQQPQQQQVKQGIGQRNTRYPTVHTLRKGRGQQKTPEEKSCRTHRYRHVETQLDTLEPVAGGGHQMDKSGGEKRPEKQIE